MKKIFIFTLILLFSLSYAEVGKISQGMAFFKAGNYAKAEPIFRDNIDINPKLYILYPFLINSLYYDKKYDTALEYLDKLKSFKDKNALKEYNSISSEVRAKINIENKKYGSALKEINSGLKKEKDIIVKNKLFDLKFLVFLLQKDYSSAEKLITSKKNWDKNPRYLLFMSKLKFEEKQLNDYFKDLALSWTLSNKSNNSILIENIKNEILDEINNFKDRAAKLKFIEEIHKNNIDYPKLNNLKNAIEKKIQFDKDLNELKLLISQKRYKEASNKLNYMKNNYKHNLSVFDNVIHDVKKKQMLKYAIYGGAGISGLVILILIIALINKGGKKKNKTKTGKIKSSGKEMSKEAGEKETNTIEAKIAKENIEEKTHEGPIAEEEKGEEETLKEEPNGEIGISNIKDENPQSEKIVEQGKNTEELPAETIEIEDIEEPASEDTGEIGIINEFKDILKDEDSKREKNFINSYNNRADLIEIFKILYYLHHKQYVKALNLMKTKNECMNYLQDYIDNISQECDTVGKAGICFIYYKNCNNEEKKNYFLELGKRLKNEKN